MKTKSELVPFRKIKKGGFFRPTRATKQLRQKVDGRYAQVVAGPTLGNIDNFRGVWVIPVAASIVVRA